ncbi:hypothetical protein FRB90_006780 [Tulasnella sp. 427]|nr:hypothetical protein FRB90_006780 [Tulasnella sp. 427]
MVVILPGSYSLLSNENPTGHSSGEIALYEAIEFAVRRRRNSRVPFNILPIDIIHHVFAETLDLHWIHDLDFPVKSIEAHRTKLYLLRRVSVSWNALILATPTYWAAVNLGVSLPVLETALARAQNSPLCLYSLELTSEVSDHNQRLAIVAKRLTQLRSIRTSETRIAGFCQRILRLPLLNLATVEFSFDYGWSSNIQTFPKELRTLRQIKAIKWIPDLSPGQIQHLRKLTIGTSVELGSKAIELLAACTNLVSLSIKAHNSYAGNYNFGSASPGATLPHLQVLDLEFDLIKGFKDFSRLLVTPINVQASLAIDRIYETDSTSQAIDDLSDFLCPKNPPSTPPEAVTMRFNYPLKTSLSLRVKTTYTVGSRSLRLFSSRVEELTGRYFDVIKGIQANLEDPPTTIELVGYSKADRIIRRLGTLNVRVLRVRFHETVNDVLALIGSHEPELPSGTVDTTEWPFESLQELFIEGGSMDIKQLSRVVGIRQRYLRASSKSWLKKVALIGCYLNGRSLEKAEKELSKMGVTISKTDCTTF